MRRRRRLERLELVFDHRRPRTPCAKDQLELTNSGQLTVGTDKPAFPPYFEDDDPTNGKGFESAVAYAVADQLGFRRPT